jgi:Zn-dependent protease
MEFSLDLFTILVILGCLVISISIHEMMHAYTGLKLGDTTARDAGRISLNPLSHIDPVLTVLLPIVTLVLFGAVILAAKPVPFNPGNVRFEEFGAALIALAGPLVNFVLAIIGAGILLLLSPVGIIYDIVMIFTTLNVAIGVFNMVPIPPLDGSRVLYAFAPDSIRRVMEGMEQFGIFLVFALILLVPGFIPVIRNITESIIQILI